jgi:putative membrane protein
MVTRLLLASVHLLGLGVGLGAVWARGRALRGQLDATGLRRVFYADSWWGLAAVLWIGTGLARLLSSVEKGTAYYLHNHLFWGKMGCFVLILLLELTPMVALIKWRTQVGRGQHPDTHAAGRLASISVLQAALVVLMVLFATAMARGFGVPRG